MIPRSLACPRALLSLLIIVLALPTVLAAQVNQWVPVGPGGGGALFLPSINPHNTEEMFIACDMSELFHTTNSGRAWAPVDFRQIQTSGTIGRVEHTSDPNICYALTYQNETPRAVKSTDGGISWNGLPSDPTDGGAFNLLADPGSATRILVTDYTTLFVSTNGGASFTQRYSDNDGLHIGGAFFDGNNIYLGTNVGLLVSTDGGASFTKSSAQGIPSDEAIVSMAGARQGSTIRLVCVTLGSGDVYPGVTGADHDTYQGVYTLDVGAGSWTARGGAIPSGAHPFFAGMARGNTEVMYVAGGSDDGTPTVYRSTNGGSMWTSVLLTQNNANVATGWSGHQGDRAWSYGEYALGFAVAGSDPNTAIITDLGFVHVTIDGGASWRQAYVNSTDANAANAPTPKGKSYHSIGLENTTAWQVAFIDSLHLFGCYSDIRGTISTDGGATWGFGYSGHTDNSMYRIAVHPNTGVLYGATGSVHDMYQSTRLTDATIDNGRGKVLYSADKGLTWQLLHDFQHTVVWVTLDPANPNRLYAAVAHSTEGGIYVSNDIQNGAASQWTKLANPPRTEGHPFNIHVLKDGTLLCTYSGRRTSEFTASSGVFVSTNGGTSWQDRSSQQMLYWTKDVVIDPHDPAQNTWYTGVFSGWGGAPNGLGGLYRTTNRGTSWTKILDQDRVTSCAINPQNPAQMYATTETAGLWYSANVNTASPTFTSVSNYSFRQPERVFFDPHRTGRIWVTSFGNGLRYYQTQQQNLSAPQLLFPADDTVGVTSSFLLSWRSVDAATAYQLQVSTSEDFSTLTVDNLGDNAFTTGITVQGLATGTTYYWRVRAMDGSTPGPWSEVWSFKTVTPVALVAPALVAPGNDTTGLLQPYQFTWSPVTDAVHYEMQTARDEAFTNDMSSYLIPAAGAYKTLSGLPAGTKYYWRVRAVNYMENGPWSGTWAFTTLESGPITAAPVLISPPDGAPEIAASTLLNWHRTPFATGYDVQIDTTTLFIGTPILQMTDTSTRATNLRLNTTYYWRVRGRNTNETGPWSETWRFSTMQPGAVDAGDDAAGTALHVITPMPSRGDEPLMLAVQLPRTGTGSVIVTDAMGRQVARLIKGRMDAGRTMLRWDPRSLPSGTYFCVLTFGGTVRTERMVITR